jgi:hypothetical protein
MSIDSVLPNGYSDTKLVCKHVIAATIGKYPEVLSAAMSVRVGQIAGSKATGYWNSVEYFASLGQVGPDAGTSA